MEHPRGHRPVYGYRTRWTIQIVLALAVCSPLVLVHPAFRALLHSRIGPGQAALALLGGIVVLVRGCVASL